MLAESDLKSLRFLVDLASPPACLLCGVDLGRADSGVCPSCARRIAETDPVVASGLPGVGDIVAAGPYAGVTGELVRSLKFRRHRLAAVEGSRLLASALESKTPGLLIEDTLVVPVPPSPSRWLMRGFDAAEELSIALATRLGLPWGRLLERASGPRQTGRGRAERLAERPRIRLRSGHPAPHPAVLVIDDVFTTGATIASCVEALRRAGFSQVSAACLARTGSPD